MTSPYLERPTRSEAERLRLDWLKALAKKYDYAIWYDTKAGHWRYRRGSIEVGSVIDRIQTTEGAYEAVLADRIESERGQHD